MTTSTPTNNIYWSVGGALISLGLLQRSPKGNLAIGLGTLILGVKLREALSA